MLELCDLQVIDRERDFTSCDGPFLRHLPERNCMVVKLGPLPLGMSHIEGYANFILQIIPIRGT